MAFVSLSSIHRHIFLEVVVHASPFVASYYLYLEAEQGFFLRESQCLELRLIGLCPRKLLPQHILHYR